MSTKRSTQILAASALTALLATSATATAAAAAPRATPDPLGPRLQAVLDEGMRSPQTRFPGVALHVRRPGRAAWSGAAGRARIAPARPMRAGDRFRAGSIMKTFVATATLQLVEAGRLRLDAPLPAVVPAPVAARFPEAGRITVRMLLNHTSGIADFSDAAHDREIAAAPRRRWSTGEQLDRAAALPPTGAPGERFAYSNTNFTLLGLVLEQATGRPWRAVVRDRIVRPLRLTSTSLPEPGAMPAGRDIARGYEPIGGRLVDLTEIDSSMAGAAGGHAMLTTTRDLSRFLRALLDGRLFRRASTLKAMRTWVATPNENGRVGYGLGLERFVLPGGLEVVGHMGTTGGYRAFMFHLPATRTDLAMVTTAPVDPMPVLLLALRLLAG